jgi:hypothetical protein
MIMENEGQQDIFAIKESKTEEEIKNWERGIPTNPGTFEFSEIYHEPNPILDKLNPVTEEKSSSGGEIILGIAVIGILLLFFKNIS